MYPFFTTHYTVKTTTPLIDAILSMKRCHSVIIALFSSSTVFKFLSVIDSLLKGTPNSIIYWIKISSVWGPHVRLDEVDVLFFT